MPRRTKEEALATRNALLDAAERLFEADGVSGTSLQDIAGAAGVTRGAVYWHFRDKADLFNAMMERATLPFEQQFAEVEKNAGADPLERLRGLAVDVLNQTASQPHLQRVFTIATLKVEYAGELGAVRERHLRVRENSLRMFEGLLRQAAAQGRLAAGVSPRHGALALKALLHGLIYNWMLDRDAFDLKRAGRAAVDSLMAGLACEAPPAVTPSRRRRSS